VVVPYTQGGCTWSLLQFSKRRSRCRDYRQTPVNHDTIQCANPFTVLLDKNGRIKAIANRDGEPDLLEGVPSTLRHFPRFIYWHVSVQPFAPHLNK
jgi:hypothetical protein